MDALELEPGSAGEQPSLHSRKVLPKYLQCGDRYPYCTGAQLVRASLIARL